MTAVPDPTPADTTGLLAALLGQHVARVGPITGSWSCPCGAYAVNRLSGDPEFAAVRADREAQWAAHLAEVIVRDGRLVPAADVREGSEARDALLAAEQTLRSYADKRARPVVVHEQTPPALTQEDR